jgi:hydroxymethylbilane synthase
MELVAQINHEPTFIAVAAERAFAVTVGGNCNTPLAAQALLEAGQLMLLAMIGHASGQMVSGSITGPAHEAVNLGNTLAGQLLANGGAELLQSHVSTSTPGRP